ncbi:hypothetical protein ACFHW2_40155 [Actinomadura sp. LOL_016]|uniref:hypothetical protein n=1 Tax=unclassified Actinomadura TaxID=2626254 RepID=UPI003A80E7D4
MEFSKNDRLFAALKRIAPQMATSWVPIDGGSTRLCVSYRHRGPSRVEWDGDRYTWVARCGPELGDDPEVAAVRIASDLGATPLTPHINTGTS